MALPHLPRPRWTQSLLPGHGRLRFLSSRLTPLLCPAPRTSAIPHSHSHFSPILAPVRLPLHSSRSPSPPSGPVPFLTFSHFHTTGSGPYLLSLGLLDETGDLLLLLCFQLLHKEEQLPPLGTAQRLCSLSRLLSQVRQRVQPPRGLAEKRLRNCRTAEQGRALSALPIPPYSAAHPTCPKERAHGDCLGRRGPHYPTAGCETGR